jgi:hypothetical protein
MIQIIGSALLGLGAPCTIEIKLNKQEGRKMATIKDK